MPILMSKTSFWRLGQWNYSPRCHSIFAEVTFRVRYGAPLVRSLRQFGVNLYRRRVLRVVYSTDPSSRMPEDDLGSVLHILYYGRYFVRWVFWLSLLLDFGRHTILKWPEPEWLFRENVWCFNGRICIGHNHRIFAKLRYTCLRLGQNPFNTKNRYIPHARTPAFGQTNVLSTAAITVVTCVHTSKRVYDRCEAPAYESSGQGSGGNSCIAHSWRSQCIRGGLRIFKIDQIFWIVLVRNLLLLKMHAVPSFELPLKLLAPPPLISIHEDVHE